MKPKREITLGEMQDECSFRGDNCETIGGDKCKFFELCATMQTIDKGCLTPIMWNLTDPPRFTEAQMALLRALWDMGARTVRSGYTTDVCARADDERGELLFAWVGKPVGLTLQLGETLDLAEMFGKEGTK